MVYAHARGRCFDSDVSLNGLGESGGKRIGGPTAWEGTTRGFFSLVLVPRLVLREDSERCAVVLAIVPPVEKDRHGELELALERVRSTNQAVMAQRSYACTLRSLFSPIVNASHKFPGVPMPT
ncbi:hypothetical protein EVG20_g4867 [Dentipellis fragilis]|uniref:Uncharacterized protein n=1 Tax=Dentipellis fragilis TaxID=205917 RepID=A0A4Y9YWT4_9AGAM|nr:hypothetical protein EVG20_g4867 [Dentipellis fragilis]